jgi:hypothetical protein
LPARLGLPLSRFHLPDLRAALIGRGIVATISDKTIWRWLAADAIRPWAHLSWIFPRAPAFAAKAGRVLALYARRFEGKRLRPDEYVISADEKTFIQARHRRHSTRPASPRHPLLVEHEYHRRGALVYLAAWDVHHAKLFGHLEPKNGIQPIDRLVTQVMKTEPYRSARRVSWIADKGSAHRGQAASHRLRRDYSNLALVHLPLHASWLNQIEIYFRSWSARY